jgi:hypothetical protein
MARLTSKRAVKKSPTKRALTVSQRLQRKSSGELISLLAYYPNTKFNPIIRKYLNIKYGMSDEEINTRINRIREKKEIKHDLSLYYTGQITEKDVAKKYPSKQFIKEPGVHATAKYYNKFEIPTGMTHGGHTSGTERPGKYTIERPGKLPEKVTKITSSAVRVSRPRTVQRLLIENPVIWSEYLSQRRSIKNHLEHGRMDSAERDVKILEEWLLQLAQDRPEFAANVAYILYTDHPMKESKHSFGKNAKLKALMEDVLTEREMAQYRRNPFIQPLKPQTGKPYLKHKPTIAIDEDGMLDKLPVDEDDDSMTKFKGEIGVLPIPGAIAFDSKNKRFFEVHNKGGVGSLKNIGFTEKPKYRKKKIKRKAPSRKKIRKVVKVRKPIKKCRCK